MTRRVFLGDAHPVLPNSRVNDVRFASASAQQANRPKTLEAIVLSQRLNDCFAPSRPTGGTDSLASTDILTIAILAVLSGGNGWEDMEIYGVSKQAWLSSFLALPNGIPSADTFPRVFERLNPKQFEHCFEQWVNQLVQELFRSSLLMART